MKVEDFSKEIAAAVKAYEHYIVCIDKTPDEFFKSVQSLMARAIKVYEDRAPGLKHGIALDSQITIILSEPPEPASAERPLCGIYFNLHTPYRKRSAPAKSKA